MKYPRVSQERCSIEVEFAPEPPGVKREPLRMVLDFGAFGEVLGIEIINMATEAGRSALDVISEAVPTHGDGVRYAYDEETDCFYLRLNAGRSLDQRSVDGTATCDERGRVVSLMAEWEESPPKS